jgi:hypothetical protein
LPVKEEGGHDGDRSYWSAASKIRKVCNVFETGDKAKSAPVSAGRREDILGRSLAQEEGLEICEERGSWMEKKVSSGKHNNLDR